MICVTLVGIGIVLVMRPAIPAPYMGLAIICGPAVGALMWIQGQRQTALRLRERTELSDEEIFRNFFADAGLPFDVVIGLWHEASDVFGITPGKMRPTDRFGEELGAYWITSDSLDLLANLAIKHAQSHSRVIDLSQVTTLGQYVLELASLLNESVDVKQLPHI
jgi:hypothetical protein